MTDQSVTRRVLIAGTALLLAVPARAQTTPARTSAAAYLPTARAVGDFLETTSRLAHEKTRTAAVRRFALAEVGEQVALADRLAQAAGGRAPASPAAEPGGAAGGLTNAQRAAIYAQLQTFPAGREFDTLYVQAQARAHREALAVHGGYAEGGDDAELQAIARAAVPLIRRHLAILRGLGGARAG